MLHLSEKLDERGNSDHINSKKPKDFKSIIRNSAVLQNLEYRQSKECFM